MDVSPLASPAWGCLLRGSNYEVTHLKKTRAQKSPALRGFEEDPEYFQIDIWWSLAGTHLAKDNLKIPPKSTVNTRLWWRSTARVCSNKCSNFRSSYGAVYTKNWFEPFRTVNIRWFAILDRFQLEVELAIRMFPLLSSGIILNHLWRELRKPYGW